MRCGWWRRWYTLEGKYSLAFLARGGLHHAMGGRAYTRTLEHVHDTYTYFISYEQPISNEISNVSRHALRRG